MQHSKIFGSLFKYTDMHRDGRPGILAELQWGCDPTTQDSNPKKGNAAITKKQMRFDAPLEVSPLALRLRNESAAASSDDM